jgi:cbb3-type cytochrome oxidase maturation protein
MSVLLLMIPIALVLGLGFVFAFIWAAKSEQFDDVETPAHRILFDEYKKNDVLEK